MISVMSQVDLGEDEDKFEAFMMPLTSAFESLGAVLAAGSSTFSLATEHPNTVTQADS